MFASGIRNGKCRFEPIPDGDQIQSATPDYREKKMFRIKGFRLQSLLRPETHILFCQMTGSLHSHKQLGERKTTSSIKTQITHTTGCDLKFDIISPWGKGLFYTQSCTNSHNTRRMMRSFPFFSKITSISWIPNIQFHDPNWDNGPNSQNHTSPKSNQIPGNASEPSSDEGFSLLDAAKHAAPNDVISLIQC